jgi:15-cis-phytoene synthase
MESFAIPAANQKRVFNKKASSFSNAAAWLPEQSRRQVTELYCFLRTVDDLVDDSDNPANAALNLESFCAGLSLAGDSKHVRVPGVSFPLDKQSLFDFLDGQKSDLEWCPVLTEAALVHYCYQVAGTVGVMLCPVLGAQGEVARQAALRLGIAMQMTNIARDILEDSRRGRLYLPANWLPSPMGPAAVTNPELADDIKRALLRLLRLAETYYRSVRPGFYQLPARQRFVVMLAARLYRQIGRKIMAAPDSALQGRVRLSRLDYMLQFARAAGQWAVTLLPFSRPAVSGESAVKSLVAEP